MKCATRQTPPEGHLGIGLLQHTLIGLLQKKVEMKFGLHRISQPPWQGQGKRKRSYFKSKGAAWAMWPVSCGRNTVLRGAKSAKGVSARTTLSARVGACERLLKRMKNTTSFALVQSLKTSKSHRQSTSRSRKLKCHSRMTGASVQIDRCVSPAQALMGRQLKTKLPVLPGNLKQTRRRRTATKRILTEGIVQCL